MKVTTTRRGCPGKSGKAIRSRYLARSLAALAALVLGVHLSGCSVDSVGEDGSELSAPDAPQDEALCNGSEAATFCDDCNPCTTDVNCTPCSTLPEAERDIYHCTPDLDLPAACVGHLGCVHLPLTTPAGQTDDCFPVVDTTLPHAGVCRVGRCDENP